MLHRKLIEPALAALEGERAAYFGQVTQRLEQDPRVELAPNLVFVMLREVMSLCPTYLPVRELVDRLLEYVAVNQARLNRIIFDPRFIEHPDTHIEMRDMGAEFINQVLSATFNKLNAGEIDTNEQRVYRFSSEDDSIDFPFGNEDE